MITETVIVPAEKPAGVIRVAPPGENEEAGEGSRIMSLKGKPSAETTFEE
jgi:hypothetical protein